MLRGQHLYIRPIEPGDASAIQRLAPEETLPSPTTGLLGKLLGETVSFARFELAGPGTLRIERLFVAPELRRKRIGRAMMAELEQLARSMDCHVLQVSHRCEERGFFLRLGFAGDQDMLEKVL
jgi:GNAT superfamily N-acetyltransferase